MTDEPMLLIRESSRNLLKSNRRIHKNEQNDIYRKLEETRVTRETIVDIVNKLKTKSITAMELDILKNSILDDQNNIEVVLSNQGSLRGLVRELSGTDVTKQLAAAGCCCNIALGDAKACVTVAKTAGPYLVTALDNFNTELAVLCAWTLGNIAGSGHRACVALHSRGVLTKLTALLTHHLLCDAALYAATHLAYHMKDDLGKEYVEKWTQILVNMNLSMESCHLLFILSCHVDFALPQEELYRVLQFTYAIRSTLKELEGLLIYRPILLLLAPKQVNFPTCTEQKSFEMSTLQILVF
ncbi:hypothetical protein evm_009469 [Chilo suppressalis]|nr:hypothetical protein evm_009469 [Chilo suppressalis]